MYTLLELRCNSTVATDHPSFGTFDVLLKLQHDDVGTISKWISIPHELFFDFISEYDTQLTAYITKCDYANWEMCIDDLIELGYDFTPAMIEYVKMWYTPFIFSSIPGYDPDYFMTRNLDGQ